MRVLALPLALATCCAAPVQHQFPVSAVPEVRFVPDAVKPISARPADEPTPEAVDSCGPGGRSGLLVARGLVGRCVERSAALEHAGADLAACVAHDGETHAAALDFQQACHGALSKAWEPVPWYDRPGPRMAIGFVAGAGAVIGGAWAAGKVTQ